MDLNVFFSSGNRTKIVRLIYHVLTWMAIWSIIRYFAVPSLTKDNVQVVEHASVVVLIQCLIMFYFLGYVIFPRFLYTKRIPSLIASVLGVFQILHITNYLEFEYLSKISDANIKGTSYYVTRVWNDYLSRYSWPECFINLKLAYFNYAWSLFYVIPILAIKVMRDIIISRTRNLRLERDRLQLEKANLDLHTRSLQLQKDNLDLELSFLKSQINPHFLFNTLNAIYTRAVDVDDQAADLVLKLADLMRYSLYESSKEKVALASEIEYIENYLDLEKARFGEKVNIRLHREGPMSDCLIAPLLLVSFVENAFKHGQGKSKLGSYVSISVVLNGPKLHFSVKNGLPASSPSTPATQGNVGGFGLANTGKRLRLLYPERHQLSIRQSETEFSVDLVIDLDATGIQAADQAYN